MEIWNTYQMVLNVYGSKDEIKLLDYVEKEFDSDLLLNPGAFIKERLIGYACSDLHNLVRGWIIYLIFLPEYRKIVTVTALLYKS